MITRLTKQITTAVVVMAGVLATMGDANATPAFARSTGAACNKCHTMDIPRLNERGLRFMRNGFQVKIEEGAEISAPGAADSAKTESEGIKKVASDLWLNKMSDVLAMYMEFQGFEKSNDNKTATIAQPDTLALLATGTLAKDVPFWAELEYAYDEGAVEADRIYVGLTNVNDSTTYNFRMGRLDPTEWSAFSGLAAEAFGSTVSKLGAYEGGEAGRDGFVAVGNGLTNRNAVEYYGYNDKLLWAVAVANTPEDYMKDDARNLDYYGLVNYEVMKGTNVSVLYYQANGQVDTNVWSAAARYHTDMLDLMGQYSRDSGATDSTLHTNEKYAGYTLQANMPINNKWMGMARYDATDNGASSDAVEAVANIGLLYKPFQNVKVTGAYAWETQSEGNVAKVNAFNVNLMLAL